MVTELGHAARDRTVEDDRLCTLGRQAKWPSEAPAAYLLDAGWLFRHRRSASRSLGWASVRECFSKAAHRPWRGGISYGCEFSA